MRNACIVFLLLTLTACTVGPDYSRPEVEVLQEWTVAYSAAADLSNAVWWRQFEDPVLDDLIDRAVRNNLDLRIAAARVDQYLGQLDTTRAQFFPQVGAGVNVSTQRTAGLTTESSQAGINATWELDLWGRIRRANEAARARLLASEQGRRAVLMTLVANVSSNYIALRGLDRQLAIARKTEKAYAETFDLFSLRFEYGTISQLQLSQARSLYESARQAVPRFESLVRQQENLLAVLVGQLPGGMPRGKEIDRLPAPGIPAGIPSTLLERRPDILQAEQNLVAANAQIGVARAAYFPTISLTGVLGSVSGDLGNLFAGGTESRSLSGGLAGPLLNFGAVSGQVAQSEALQQQALLQYRQTILNAFREVEDALVKTTKGREEFAAQKNQVEALAMTADLARLQFDQGTVDYLQVLDAERSLFAAQLEMVQKEIDLLGSLIAVYKAMGGGWIAEADRMSSPEPGAVD
jgi:outer membrane protein, multidrug efflux system